MQTQDINNKDPLELFTTEELAEKFKIKVDWLNKNRGQADPIPFIKFGRYVRYQRNEITDWLGDDELALLTTEDVVHLFKLEKRWLDHNRIGHDPIPFKKLGGLIRYHRSDVKKWLKKQSQRMH